MQDDLDSASRYIERAEEMRVIASMMSDRRTKASLLRVADDYVHMARTRKSIHDLGMAHVRADRVRYRLQVDLVPPHVAQHGMIPPRLLGRLRAPHVRLALVGELELGAGRELDFRKNSFGE